MTCNCATAGWCEARQAIVPRSMHATCQRGGGAIVDTMLTAIATTREDRTREGLGIKAQPKRLWGNDKRNRSQVIRRTNYGNTLAAIIARETGEQADCAGCQNEIASLNVMTRDQVMEQVDAIAKRIRTRAQSVARTWWQRWGATLAPELVESKIKDWIIEALDTTPQPAPRTSGKQYTQRRRADIPPRTRRNRGAFAMGTDRPRWISAAQFANDVRDFAARVPSDITAIAGVARSGLSAATMLSMYLHLPLLAIRQTLNDVIEAGNGWRLGGSSHIRPQGKVLIVDDTCMTGNSFRQVLPIMRGWDCTTAAIYCNPAATLKPDMFHSELQWPHMLEWNIFNSVLSPNMALDFDGILCHDPERWQDDDGENYRQFILNARPLYLPRKVSVPLIVTARIERYRAETMEWLNRHRIRVNQLIMHPAHSTRERERDNVAAYKARHFAAWAARHRPRPAPLMFVESDPRQAERIFQLTGHMTICPATSGVWCK